MNIIRNFRDVVDDVCLRVFYLSNKRANESLWLFLLCIPAVVIVLRQLDTFGNGLLDGLLNLSKGASLPLLSGLAIFMVWPRIKPGTDKPNINSYWILACTLLISGGLWYQLGATVALLLTVSVVVLAAMFAEAFGLTRLAVAPFFIGALSPLLMGLADNTTNVLSVRADQLLTSLGVPTRGWGEVLAMLCLVLLVSKALIEMAGARGSTVYGKQAQQPDHVVSLEDFVTQENIVRVLVKILSVKTWIFTKFLGRTGRTVAVTSFRKGRDAAVRSADKRKLEQVQRRADEDLVKAQEASAISVADIMGLSNEPQSGDFLGGAGDSDDFTELDDLDVYNVDDQHSIVAGEVVSRDRLVDSH